MLLTTVKKQMYDCTMGLSALNGQDRGVIAIISLAIRGWYLQ